MLIYTAELKIPKSQSYQQKKDKVNAVLNQLALTSCKDVRIGSTLARGISGEIWGEACTWCCICKDFQVHIT